jgi:hypothetical protein
MVDGVGKSDARWTWHVSRLPSLRAPGKPRKVPCAANKSGAKGGEVV